MIQPSVANSHRRCPHGEASDIELTPTAVSEFGGFVHELWAIVKAWTLTVKGDTAYLVKGREYIVRELDLCDSCLTHRCHTNAEPCDTLL
jgi:hypothetical protein